MTIKQIFFIFNTFFVRGQIYVDINANGLNTGSDWILAFNDLQDALEVTQLSERDYLSKIIILSLEYSFRK